MDGGFLGRRRGVQSLMPSWHQVCHYWPAVEVAKLAPRSLPPERCSTFFPSYNLHIEIAVFMSLIQQDWIASDSLY